MAKLTIAAAFVACTLYVVWLTQSTIVTFAQRAADLSLAICGALPVAIVGAGIAYVFQRQRHESRRQRDGAWAVQEYWIDPLPKRVVNWFAGRPSARAVYDHNANLSHAAIIRDAVWVVEPACGWDRQLAYMADQERTNRVRAAVTGDGVTGLPWSNIVRGANGVANAATGRMLAGAYDKPIKPAVLQREELPALPPPPPAEVSLSDALERTEAQAWPLGYADNGRMAQFNPLTHSHVAIVGAPGTGKTTSVGYLLACHALRQGWHVAILDADNGVAWAAFGLWAEHAETTTDTLPAQLNALMLEFDRRMALLHEAGATDIAGVGGVRRMLVVIEEYGDLINTLRLRDASAASVADNQLDTLLRRGRKAGMHVALIDQYPEKWSNQIIAGTKFRAVFQLGPNQGAKMQEYKAHELPDRGAFLWQSQQYNAWHTQPALRHLLAEVPAMSAGARVLGKARSTVPGSTEGVYFPEVARQNGAQNVPVGTPPGTPPEDAPGRWDDVVAAWFAANPQALTGPALGISDLARAMCRDNEGNDANYAAYKGRAHPLFHEFRNSARLPNGAKLGTDITGGA